MTETGYQMLDRGGLTSFTNNDNSANFLVEKKKVQCNFLGCLFFFWEYAKKKKNKQTNNKSDLVLVFVLVVESKGP